MSLRLVLVICLGGGKSVTVSPLSRSLLFGWQLICMYFSMLRSVVVVWSMAVSASLRIKVGWCWLLCNVTSPRAPFWHNPGCVAHPAPRSNTRSRARKCQPKVACPLERCSVFISARAQRAEAKVVDLVRTWPLRSAIPAVPKVLIVAVRVAAGLVAPTNQSVPADKQTMQLSSHAKPNSQSVSSSLRLAAAQHST